MEAKTHQKTKNQKIKIDGLPASYHSSYVTDTKKTCQYCTKRNRFITTRQIEKDDVICDENFNFYHKSCLRNKHIEYVHSKPNDKTSSIKIIL